MAQLSPDVVKKLSYYQIPKPLELQIAMANPWLIDLILS